MDLNRAAVLEYLKKNPEKMKEVYKQEDPKIMDEFFNDIYEIRLKNEPNYKSSRIIGENKVTIDDLKISIILDRFIFPKVGKVYLGKSRIHGRGVFAAKDIKAGELLTFYPADVVVIDPQINDKNGDKISICRYSKRLMDKFKDDDKSMTDCTLNTDYQSNINKNWAIVGHISSDDDSNFLGHFINDGFTGDISQMTEDEYIINSLPLINCFPIIFKRGLRIAYLALKDIFKGDEITTSYGIDYWKSRENNKDIK